MKLRFFIVAIFLIGSTSFGVSLTPENVTGFIIVKKDIKINVRTWKSPTKTIKLTHPKYGSISYDVTCSITSLGELSPSRESSLASAEVIITAGTILDLSRDISSIEKTYIFKHKKTEFSFRFDCDGTSNEEMNSKLLKNKDPLELAILQNELLIDLSTDFKTTPSLLSTVLDDFIILNLKRIRPTILD